MSQVTDKKRNMLDEPSKTSFGVRLLEYSTAAKAVVGLYFDPHRKSISIEVARGPVSVEKELKGKDLPGTTFEFLMQIKGLLFELDDKEDKLPW